MPAAEAARRLSALDAKRRVGHVGRRVALVEAALHIVRGVLLRELAVPVLELSMGLEAMQAVEVVVGGGGGGRQRRLRRSPPVLRLAICQRRLESVRPGVAVAQAQHAWLHLARVRQLLGHPRRRALQVPLAVPSVLAALVLRRRHDGAGALHG